MKNIISQILALSLKAKIAAATVAVVGITGATTAGVIHYKNVIAKNEQIKVSEIKKAKIKKDSAANIIQAVPNSTDNKSSQATSNASSTNNTDADNKTTQTVSSNTPSTPQSSTESSSASSSGNSSSSKSKAASSNTTSSNPTPSVSPYYVTPPSCSSTSYNTALTEKLWSLKKENSYEGIKASTFDNALKKYGCGDNNAINTACGYFTNPKIPTPLYKCEWNEYGYGLSCDGGDIQVSKFETSSNDAREILNQINSSSFYKGFSQASFESYFYKRVFICYNPSTKKNIVVRLGIGISKCMQQF